MEEFKETFIECVMVEVLKTHLQDEERHIDCQEEKVTLPGWTQRPKRNNPKLEFLNNNFEKEQTWK
ncbi:hypothetical protein NQZ68_014139 [Dissostichus eleginoides]|nr:hypothetical protein NQZ68_014139 [Dissostichus eleginoides]